jgi:CheY-like chemotaxis protein
MKAADAHPILLVEDNPNDVVLIRRAFAKANVANPLNVVSDGEKAISYLSGGGDYADRARFPLPLFILLDLKLPRKSGHEVVHWLRAQPVLRRIPVVVLTSSSMKSDVERCYDLGVNSYLVKPVNFDELRALMDLIRQYWVGANQAP